jgi:hypothetical protein
VRTDDDGQDLMGERISRRYDAYQRIASNPAIGCLLGQELNDFER